MMPLHGVIIHPFQPPAGWNLTRPNNFTLKQQFKHTQQDLLDKSYL
jgi:hypothetical protein